ncbi:glycosyltransferase family 2 protein [Aeromonas caviae]|uniref:glycosyltransferase family 2 protein n=1 Tax=Aeromonas caviae TaxID=648 RepID=UPI0029D849EB|nr:glycosyltransferase family 2 protein [Aeromonas caviae]MDX7863123.1 glycosyltransferase family 2 protein [Aeromonas caviae]
MIYLSICIPTKDRLTYLQETINSIINDGCDTSEFEIVISDNSDGDDTKNYAVTLQAQGINIVYYKNPIKGFYNSIEALKLGNGALLKLHNDYSSFMLGQFRGFLKQAKDNISRKPLIFFSNGTLKIELGKKNFTSKDLFIRATSFQNTWSSGFSIWKSQLGKIEHARQDVDAMFPHTSIFLNACAEEFVIDDRIYFKNIAVKNKGGYNIFYNFCVLYLDMIKDKLNRREITKITYLTIKYKLFLQFVAPWYYKTIYTEQGYTFDPSNAKYNISYAYGNIGFYLIRTLCFVNLFINKIRG